MGFKKSFLLLILMISFLGMKKKNRIIGYWEIYKIEFLSEPTKTKDKRKKFIEFHLDGKLEGGNIGSEVSKSGNWNMNCKKFILTFITPDSERDNGNYEVLKLTNKHLILLKDSVKIFLDKGTK